jgi:drug/metabolite transporter (DMT)-like permease
MIVNSAPVITAVLAACILNESLTGRLISGLGICLFGTMLLGLGEGSGFRFEPGVIFLLLAALCWALNIIVQKPSLERYSPREVTCYAVFLGTIPLLAFLPGLAESATKAPLIVTLGVVYLGALPIAVAYATWGYVLSQMAASRAAGFLYLIPLIAILSAWLFLHEIPAPLSLAGGTLVLIGVAVVNFYRS